VAVGLVAGLIAVAPAAQAATLATPAKTAPTAGWDNMDPKVLAIMRRQEALNSTTKILMDQAMKDSNGGYVSVAFEGDGLGIYWKGNLPLAMQTAVAAARRTAPVVVHPAAYSVAELDAAAAQIEKAAKGTDILSVTKRGDGSGITVQERPATATTRMPDAPTRTVESAVAAAHVRVPVQVTVAKSEIQTTSCPSGMTSCRLSDSSPWNSGDMINRFTSGASYQGWCTSGFAVWLNGQTYVLTAYHCTQGTAFYDDYANHFIGNPSGMVDVAHDLALIDARGFYWMWDGNNAYYVPNDGWADQASTRKTVHSWDYSIDNEWVCQSGATSGTRCALQTLPGRTDFYDSKTGNYFYGLREACRQQGESPASQEGDSGAPVFTLDGNGVRAKGSVTGASNDGSCMFFSDMAYIHASLGQWPGVTPRTA
jgi:hypothetical protein